MKNLFNPKDALLKAFILSALFLLPISAIAQKSDEQAATAAAEHFLQLIDSGQYQESWQQTAPLFKSQVSQEQWTSQLHGFRPLLGATVKRQIKSARYATSLPGVPDGEYFVLQYDTAYKNKKVSIETVTMSLTDEQWQVAGYLIR